MRAAAQSVQRAGCTTWCCDLFADQDLLACAPVRQIHANEYPHQFAGILRKEAPSGPVLYTGGLENQPDLIEQIGRDREILGNSASTLKRVRNPFQLADAWKAHGAVFPAVMPYAFENKASGQWLLKSMNSSGGSGVHEYAVATIGLNSKHYYWQQRIEGEPFSAVYVGNGDQAVCVGVSQQWVGQQWLNAPCFAYCGSIGPIALHESMQKQYQQLGTIIAKQFQIKGLFGIDTIHGQGAVWPIEVNPRFTASVEVYERVANQSLFHAHIAACRQASLQPAMGFIQELASHTATLVCKVILYNNATTWLFPRWEANAMAASLMANDNMILTLSDWPQAGTRMLPHQPLCSLILKLHHAPLLDVQPIIKAVVQCLRQCLDHLPKLPSAMKEKCLCS